MSVETGKSPKPSLFIFTIEVIIIIMISIRLPGTVQA